MIGFKPELDKSGIDLQSVGKSEARNKDFIKLLIAEFDRVKLDFDNYNWEVIIGWNEKVNKYKNPIYSFKVRNKEIKIETHTESLSHSQIPKVCFTKI